MVFNAAAATVFYFLVMLLKNSLFNLVLSDGGSTGLRGV